MDEGKPLDNPAEFALIRHDDGTYTVDLKKVPQWMPLDSRLFIFTDTDVFDGHVPQLKARGFRDSDITSVRTYLATHDPRQFMLPGSKSLADTFAARIRERDKAGLSTDMQEARAYFHPKKGGLRTGSSWPGCLISIDVGFWPASDQAIACRQHHSHRKFCGTKATTDSPRQATLGRSLAAAGRARDLISTDPLSEAAARPGDGLQDKRIATVRG